MKLLPRRPGNRRLQGNRHDRIFRAKILEMRLEEAEQNLDRLGRIGNVKAMFVMRLVRKRDAESELLRNEVKRAETQAELLEKAPQHKKKRLGGFDLVIEFEFFAKNFRWPNESKKPGGAADRLFP